MISNPLVDIKEAKNEYDKQLLGIYMPNLKGTILKRHKKRISKVRKLINIICQKQKK